MDKVEFHTLTLSYEGSPCFYDKPSFSCIFTTTCSDLFTHFFFCFPCFWSKSQGMQGRGAYLGTNYKFPIFCHFPTTVYQRISFSCIFSHYPLLLYLFIFNRSSLIYLILLSFLPLFVRHFLYIASTNFLSKLS